MRPSPPYRIFVGFDAAEMTAVKVAMTSLYRHTAPSEIDARRISRLWLRRLYDRPTTAMPNGQLYDEISGAPMSTDHAIARFFIPFLCEYRGWALFTDGDVLFRDDVRQLFALADPACPVMAVQHPPQEDEGAKKLGHIQQAYPRKNWSSVMLFHCGHPANRRLTREVLNSWPGRDLHAFRWLDEAAGETVGALPARWNYLVGVQPPPQDPALVHYTLGTPALPGHAQDPFADEWFAAAAAAGYDVPVVEGEAVGRG